MHTFHAHVEELARRFRESADAVAASLQTVSSPPKADAPVALLFSPHPDDECITGLLPLRLAAECGWRIVNVPVTHGSDPERQSARHAELEAACAYLGWELVESPETDTLRYAPYRVEDMLHSLRTHQPRAVFFPHRRDWNSRHVSTHEGVMDALHQMGDRFSCTVVETEFWGGMDDPNLMVEAAVAHLGDLISALSLHVGEVERNPYHLRLPAWMIDNVRRGAERLSGQGAQAPDILFATLYRLSHWDGRCLTATSPSILRTGQSPEEVF